MQKIDSYTIYLIIQGCSSLFFHTIVTVNLVYQATTVGLNPLQLVLVGTTLEAAAFLGEIPTGLVADIYSRRLSVIIGVFLTGLGFILEGSVPSFIAVLMAQVLWGIGHTFISGALEAWLTDEIGESHAGHAFLRGSQVGQITGLVGILISVMLASIQIQLPIILGGTCYLFLALFLQTFMAETAFKPTLDREQPTWQAMRTTLHEGMTLVQKRSILLTILAISTINGLYSEGFDRLWTPHLLNTFTLPTLGQLNPIVWFGIIRAVVMLLALLTSEIVRRRVDTTNQPQVVRSLFVIDTLTLTGIVIFGLSTNLAQALVAYWIAQAMRRTNDPLLTAWATQNIDSNVRATVLSIFSQSNAIGKFIGGPIVGLIGTIISLPVALVLSGLTLLPSLVLYTVTLKKDKRS